MVYLHFENVSKTSTQKPCKWLRKPSQNEAKKVQGTMESVVKRLEIWVGAIAITLCKGQSVGWNTEKKVRSFLI